MLIQSQHNQQLNSDTEDPAIDPVSVYVLERPEKTLKDTKRPDHIG